MQAYFQAGVASCSELGQPFGKAQLLKGAGRPEHPWDWAPTRLCAVSADKLLRAMPVRRGVRGSGGNLIFRMRAVLVRLTMALAFPRPLWLLQKGCAHPARTLATACCTFCPSASTLISGARRQKVHWCTFAPPPLCSCREPGVKKCTFCHRAPEIAHRPRGKNSTWFAFFRVRFGDQCTFCMLGPDSGHAFWLELARAGGFLWVRACVHAYVGAQCVHMRACARACLRACARYVYLCACVCASVVCVCVCVCHCGCVCVCMSQYESVPACGHACVGASARAYWRACAWAGGRGGVRQACMRACVCASAVCVRACVHSCARRCMRACVCCAHVRACVRASVRGCVRTRMLACVRAHARAQARVPARGAAGRWV